jgi:nitroreductase
MNETLQSIRNRRSTRAFLEEQLKEEELQEIVDAGIYAPSATNRQPWNFTVVQNKDLLDRLNESFKELARNSGNEYLERVGNNEKFHVFHNAPTVIFVSGDEKNHSAAVDCAAAVENILIAAESLGLGTCWIGFIAFLLNNEQGKAYLKELGVPEGFRQFHSVAIGYKKVNITNAPKRKENTVNYVR